MASSNRQKIILLTGAINAGKSTVGRLLAKRLNYSFVEGDTIRGFIFWRVLDEILPQVIEGIAASVATLVEQGYSVVVAYPLRQQDYNVLLKKWKKLSVTVHTFALNPKIEVALTNRGTRKLTEWEINRIGELYNMRINNPPFATVIDNSHLSTEETAEKIIKFLRKNDTIDT